MKRRVLFVDDDRSILEGLRVRLRGMRAEWDMRFVESGKAALELLAAEPFDVLVTDMRMPEMDGATLLHRVRAEHPRVARIVLSGHAELETALRAVPVAHQFLAKPCAPGVIEGVVERACRLQARIASSTLRDVVGRIDRLPSLPGVYFELVSVMNRDSVSTDEVAKILRRDAAMTAKTLQIVNSAFFRLPRKIARIEEAVAYLGFVTVKRAVLAAEIFQFAATATRTREALAAVQRHSVHVGNLAATIVADPADREDAFVAGLLHDIGQLAVAAELPDEYHQVLDIQSRDRCPTHVVEERLWGGVSHAEVGGYLLSLWGLPYPIVEAVTYHHHPMDVASPDLDLLAATHIADAILSELEPGSKGPPTPLDPEVVSLVGVAGRLDEWKAIARRALDRTAEEA